MLPFLDAGIAKIRELMENAARLHIVLSTEDVIAAMKFNQELRTLWASIKIGIFRVGSALIPVLSDWAKKLIDMIAVIAEFIKQNSGIVVSALYIGAGLLIAGTALIAFGTIVNSVSKILSVVRTALNAFMIVLNLAFSPLGLVVGIVLEIIVILGYWGDILDWLGNKFGLLKSDALEAFEGIAAALAAGDIGLAARILWLTLKTEWQKGTVALLTIWVEFKRTFLELWDGLGYAMILSWDTAVYGIKIAWAETIAFLKKLTLDWKTTFADVLDWITSKILQVFHPEYSAEKIQEVLEKRKAERWTAAGKEKELSTIEAEKKSAEEKAAKTYEEQKTAIGESYGRDLEKIGKGAAEGQKEIEDTQKGLDETAKQLQESIKRAKKEAAGGMPGMPGKAPTMPNLSLAMEKATAFGTFGAFGLKEIGVGGIGQQMVDLLSDIKGSNRDIADNTEEGSEFT
jgi:hypothetical protein